MEDQDFKDIILYEIRELRKDVKKLNNFKAKISGIVVTVLFAFEIIKQKFFH